MTEKLSALKKDGWMEFSMNAKPKCPHCGSDFDISHNEAWELYDDNDRHDIECPCCDNTFQVTSHSSWTFSTDEQGDDA